MITICMFELDGTSYCERLWKREILLYRDAATDPDQIGSRPKYWRYTLNEVEVEISKSPAASSATFKYSNYRSIQLNLMFRMKLKTSTPLPQNAYRGFSVIYQALLRRRHRCT